MIHTPRAKSASCGRRTFPSRFVSLADANETLAAQRDHAQIPERASAMTIQIRRILGLVASHQSNWIGLHGMRIAIAVVFLWIGGLKFVPYEADSITPFVANNPVMSLFYEHPDQYARHLTREGELKPAERTWQTANDTYGFSRGLGTVELAIGFLTLAGLVYRRMGLAGAILAFLTPFVTLSFLLTTPEAWVPALGDAQHGFPYLSGAGRLVLKDVMLMAGGWLVLADSARAVLAARQISPQTVGQSGAAAAQLRT
jgi:uncharacterized membrane protein YkgB